MLSFEGGAVFDLYINSIATAAINIQIIGITREGIFKFTHTNNGSGSVNSEGFRIPDVPIFVSVLTTSGYIERGEFWAKLYLRINGEKIYKLLSGYVTTYNALSWPKGQHESQLSGGGKSKLVTVANPAAGANFTTTVPSGEHWIVKAVFFKLTTDANVANRLVGLKLDTDGDGKSLVLFNANAHSAGWVGYHNFSHSGAGSERTGDYWLSPLPPDIHITEGGIIASLITNIQATDQIADIRILVEQYLEA